jgi:molybdopterin-binding protein
VETLSTEQAAELLHVHVKRVQELAREGRLPATRIGRKWLFRRSEIESMLGARAPVDDFVGLELSARNRLRGTISLLRFDGLMAEVVVKIGDQELVSVITRSSAERLRLRIGDPVVAVIKSTEIMIGRTDAER